MIKSMVAAVLAAVLVSGCSHQVKTTASPATNVRPANGEKLPGSYRLLVQSDIMTKEVDPTSFTCGGPDYPIDARESFKQSARDTMVQLVEKLEPVEQAMMPEQLQAGQYRGQIIIRATAYDAQLKFNPGLFSGTASATVTIAAFLAVDGPSGRLLETEESDVRTVQTDVFSCASGAEVLADANSKATMGLLERLAKNFSRVPSLRTAALP